MDDSSRERLLKSAAKLFSKKGFDRVSIREIARESDCNICLVSYYFGGKEKLYQSIFEKFFSRIDRHLEEMRSLNENVSLSITRDDFVSQVRHQIRFMLHEFSAEPEVKVMLHRELMDGFPYTQKIFDKHFASLKQGVTQLYDRAQKSGLIKSSIHVPTFVVLLNRGIEAYFVSYIFAKPVRDLGIDPSKEAERFIEQVEEIYLKGVLT